MLENDKNVLAKLVQEYDLDIVLSVLVEIGQARADQLSDLGLKEQACVSLELLEQLKEICGFEQENRY